MGTDLTLPQGFGALPAAFAGHKADNSELGQGIAASYGIMGFRGKVWTAKYQGNEMQLMRDDGDGPRNSIEVVLVKASPAISKIFYKSGYVDGSNAAPDCWSANGITPDASVQNKVNPTCADCPMNAWGSRVSEAGKQGKACADSRRVAIVPLADMDNEMFGGPMLLRIPAASLKDLKAYGEFMNSYSYPYYAVATRISFDAKEAYPKFVFSAIRALSDVEAQKIMALRDDPRVHAVLAEKFEVTHAGNPGTAVAAAPASPFEQPAPAQPVQAAPAPAPAAVATNPFGAPVAAPAPAPAPAPVAPAPAPQPTPTPAPVQAAPVAPAPAPVTNPFGGPAVVQEEAAAPVASAAAEAPAQQPPASKPAAAPAETNAPASFDQMLGDILGG